jgi:hypothetical protein
MQFAADFDDAVLGLALPDGVEDALREAGGLRHEPERAMAALMRAQRLAPDHPAVLIALYRHHFYGHRLRAARDIARKALVAGAAALGIPAVWREVLAQPIAGARHDARTRFYLFALKGYAYLSLRLHELPEAAQALALLRALDPQDCVGGALLESARRRALAPPPEDEADVPAYVQVTGAAAWAALP